MKRLAETTPDELKAEIAAEEARQDDNKEASPRVAVSGIASVEELKKEPELKKPIMNKKIRIALLTGYNGMEFSGS